MTSSQNAVIRTEYGAHDVPYPVLNCPVLVMARVVDYANHGGRFCELTDLLISEATQVADLIQRLSEPVEYVDFTVHDGVQVLRLRMRTLEHNGAGVVCIDFRQQPVSQTNRPAEAADSPTVISGLLR